MKKIKRTQRRGDKTKRTDSCVRRRECGLVEDANEKRNEENKKTEKKDEREGEGYKEEVRTDRGTVVRYTTRYILFVEDRKITAKRKKQQK